ncbi:poly(A) RNA polymerase, mitochondrial-like [Brevipalpus obovatus]|uniref:poly(A) RNA polymerase, mitochondrial-like n=1 Tax=Brevipalpus obovatus TaxID=246614 RepID=UPI003D9E2B46
MTRPMLSTPVWNVYRKSAQKYYQQSFPSFSKMIENEKREAGQMILVADYQSQRLPNVTHDGMERLLDVQIGKMYPYRLNSNHFCLICLKDHRDIFRMKVNNSVKLTRFLTVDPVKVKQFITDSNHRTVFENIIQKRLVWRSLLDNPQDFDSENYVNSLLNSVLVNELESKLRFFLMVQLEQILSRIFSTKMDLLPFGSSVNGFGWKSSDLDLTLLPRESVESNLNQDEQNFDFDGPMPKSEKLKLNFSINPREEARRILKVVYHSIEKNHPGVRGVIPILNARVPIVKFHSIHTSLDCDLAFHLDSHISGTDIANALYAYSKMDDRVIKLMVITKIWAEIQELTRKKAPGPYLTNFSLMMLVIHFLQIREPRRILPSISSLNLFINEKCHDETNHPSPETPEVIAIRDSDADHDDSTSFVQLLTEFFHHLSTFNFDLYGCDVIEGCVTHKPCNDPIYIKNPLQCELNVSKNISSNEKFRIKFVADYSYKLLSQGGHVREIFRPVSKKDLSVKEFID